MARHSSIMVSRTLYQVGVVTLITAIIWVFVGVYLAAGKTTLVDVDKSILEPINPSIDQDTIQKLSERVKIEVDLTSPTLSSTSAQINLIEEVTTLSGEEIDTNTTQAPTSISSESATILEGGAR